jgi:hypothetical protein
MKKYIILGAGAAIILSMFLPFTSVLGISVSGMKMGGVARFYIVCGIGLIGIALADKRGLYAGAIVIGLIVALLDMKYQSDVKRVASSEVGIGLWVLLLGAVAALVGGVMGVIKKKKALYA